MTTLQNIPKNNFFTLAVILTSLNSIIGTIAVAQEHTNSGILRLTRDFWITEAEVCSGPENWFVSPDILATKSRGPLDLDLIETSGKSKPIKTERYLWKTFQPPLMWKDRPVWLTYDARRLAQTGICQLLLNGKAVPIGLPRVMQPGEVLLPLQRKDDVLPVQALDEPDIYQKAPWFIDIGPQLHFDRPNILAFKIGSGPLVRNAGAWLYSPPQKERVLFLASDGLSSSARQKIKSYAGYVQKYFNIDPLIEVRSFENPFLLRDYLKNAYNKNKISGALLIGSHPFPLFRHRKDREPSGYPRFYEDLDATFTDTDGDNIPDKVATETFGTEIWTAWILICPEYPELFEPYLQKIVNYYEGRMVYPAGQLILPDGKEVMEVMATEDYPGLDHIDLFMRPSSLVRVGTHGGQGHLAGPHMRISNEEALGFYPGGLVVRLAGCLAGNLTDDQISPGEAYLLGRSNTMLILTNATSMGGASPDRQFGWHNELLNICPYFGPYYTAHIELTGSRKNAGYLDTGFIMLGNPFINLKHDFSAPSGTVTGQVRFASDRPAEGFYVSAFRNGKCYGRIRTTDSGFYKLECLPPGTYQMQLNVNALESLNQSIRINGDQISTLDWKLPPHWFVNGQVIDENGQPDPRGWAEIGLRADQVEFTKNDLYGLRTDDTGRFQVYGTRPTTFWLQGRSGRKLKSEPIQINIKAGENYQDVILRLDLPPMLRADKRGQDVSSFMQSEHQVLIQLTQDEILHPTTDITSLYFGIFPEGHNTLQNKGKTPLKYSQRPRAPYTLRLGLCLGETLDSTPTDYKHSYNWRIITHKHRSQKGPFPLRDVESNIRISFNRISAKWNILFNWRNKAPREFWPSPRAHVIGPWIFCDITAYADTPDLDYLLCVIAHSNASGHSQSEKVPEKLRWYHLKASLDQSPSISVKLFPSNSKVEGDH